MSEPEIAIAVDAVSKRFVTRTGARVPVLDSISLVIRSREILCLLGPSGCGKTTLLRLLAGIEAPDEGRIKMERFDQDPASVTYMPQGDSLLPWRTVSANVRLGLEIRHWRKVEAEVRVRELLERVELWDQRDRFPSELSGGMRRRAALARTLAVQASVLLLDEPLTSLDFVARQALASVIRSEAIKSGVAAVVVTHSIGEAAVLADRIIILNGSPAKIIQEVVQNAGSGELTDDNLRSLLPEWDSNLYDRIVTSLRTGAGK